jgi:subfamily B ATP-binding cassette protein MsbA
MPPEIEQAVHEPFEHEGVEHEERLTTRIAELAKARRPSFAAKISRVAPLLRLLGYVKRHRRFAVLTLAFGVVGFLLSFAYPWIIGNVVDLVAGNGALSNAGNGALSNAGNGALTVAARRTRLVQLSVLACGVALLHAVVVYGRGHFNVKLGDAIVTDLRKALFEHLQRLSMRFYARERAGGILARVLHDVQDATAIIYAGVFVAAMDAVQLAIAVALLWAINWKLTIACILLFPLYALVFWTMNPRVRRASEKVHGHMAQISANMAEQLAGQALVKTYTAEQREARRFSGEVNDHHRLVVAQSHEGHLVAGSGEVLVHFGTTIVIGYGGYLALSGELSPGSMTRFLGYVIVMYGPVRRFAELNITYQSSLAAIRRVFRVLGIAPSVRDADRPVEHAPRLGHVRFEDVRFRYADDSDETRARLDDDDADRRVSGGGSPASGEYVIDGVTLECRPGERIAVVGPSGAGKTTLLSLLPRLYDVNGGRILVDGVDVRQYSLRALRSSIAIVQQESFVFSGTIRENIAYGRPEATSEEIVAAAKAAHAHEFVMRTPHGYESRLGERGVNLSGGQRQRLSIARALLKDPRILILDEATSSLDTESERKVQRALEHLMRGRTCFVIAHRLSTIRDADRIVVLDGGRIAECGTHAELLSRGGIYTRLVANQAQMVGPQVRASLVGC